ncbi:MAG: hypothetical protein HZB19_22065 [Chloroflexi bacterium]|nr:hypothetical protein [Chloroflexota bacterium]
MQRLLLIGLFLTLTACASAPQPMNTPSSIPAALSDLGPAPELTSDTWLNVDSPLRLTDLRGKVVAIDMWTFG